MLYMVTGQKFILFSFKINIQRCSYKENIQKVIVTQNRWKYNLKFQIQNCFVLLFCYVIDASK